MRLSPGFAFGRASALFSAKSPYFASPTIGSSRCCKWTRIWWVRPVFSSAFQQRVVRPAVDQVEHRVRRQTVGLRARGARRPRSDICAAAPSPRAGGPSRSPIRRGRRMKYALVHSVLADLVVQIDERRALLGEHEDAGASRDPAGARARETSPAGATARICSMTPKGDAASAMHRDAGRFVYDEKVLVFRNDPEFGARNRRVTAPFRHVARRGWAARAPGRRVQAGTARRSGPC